VLVVVCRTTATIVIPWYPTSGCADLEDSAVARVHSRWHIEIGQSLCYRGRMNGTSYTPAVLVWKPRYGFRSVVYESVQTWGTLDVYWRNRPGTSFSSLKCWRNIDWPKWAVLFQTRTPVGWKW
jgi:hypothetical protein